MSFPRRSDQIALRSGGASVADEGIGPKRKDGPSAGDTEVASQPDLSSFRIYGRASPKHMILWVVPAVGWGRWRQFQLSSFGMNATGARSLTRVDAGLPELARAIDAAPG
jgi:hypothetical protein